MKLEGTATFDDAVDFDRVGMPEEARVIAWIPASGGAYRVRMGTVADYWTHTAHQIRFDFALDDDETDPRTIETDEEFGVRLRIVQKGQVIEGRIEWTPEAA